MSIIARKGGAMAELEEFKSKIDQGGAACRVDAWDSVLVFRIIDGKFNSYFVGGLSNEHPVECLSWGEVKSELGDWADYGGWQSYRML